MQCFFICVHVMYNLHVHVYVLHRIRCTCIYSMFTWNVNIKCMFVKLQYGLTRMLQKEDGLIVFVRAMDPYNEGMMTDVLRVVAAVCLVADGYDSCILSFY